MQQQMKADEESIVEVINLVVDSTKDEGREFEDLCSVDLIWRWKMEDEGWKIGYSVRRN